MEGRVDEMSLFYCKKQAVIHTGSKIHPVMTCSHAKARVMGSDLGTGMSLTSKAIHGNDRLMRRCIRKIKKERFISIPLLHPLN